MQSALNSCCKWLRLYSFNLVRIFLRKHSRSTARNQKHFLMMIIFEVHSGGGPNGGGGS